MTELEDQMYEALKSMAGLMLRDSKGIDVSDTEWGNCHAACGIAVRAYEENNVRKEAPKAKTEDKSKKKVGRPSAFRSRF